MSFPNTVLASLNDLERAMTAAGFKGDFAVVVEPKAFKRLVAAFCPDRPGDVPAQELQFTYDSGTVTIRRSA